VTITAVEDQPVPVVPASATRDLPHADLPRRAALDLLLSRQSRWPLTVPAPSDEEMDLVFDLALRAPDHAGLRPWRFVTIQGSARDALGEVFVAAARERNPPDDAERFRAKALAAPLIVAMAVRLRAGHKVPEIEQLMAGGAAAMNMLNALHLLGYGGFWATGANAYDQRVRHALGFGAQDRLLGFMYVGTPKQPSAAPARPDRSSHVRDWTGTTMTQPSSPTEAQA
jgi:nitroreductase